MKISGKSASLVAAAAIAVGALGGVAANAATIAPGSQVAAIADAAHQTIAQILAPLVSKGVITQTQADAVAEAIKSARPEHPDKPFGGPGMMIRMGVSTDAATYLGLSTDTIHTQLQAGKSLGEIADATSGKSRAGLIAALTTAENARIDAAVTAGKLTADQATKLKTGITERVTALVDRKGLGQPRGPRLGGDHPGRGERPAPSASPTATN